MAYLFKRTVIRYVDADDKRCRKDTPGARKLKTKSKDWYRRYRDSDGIQQELRLCPNKEAAKQQLNAKLLRARMRTRSPPNDEAVHRPRR